MTEGPALAKVSMSRGQEVIRLGCWNGLAVAGGAAGELRGQTINATYVALSLHFML